MTDDLVTEMLPILGRSLDLGFNVFDVMHHGTHEKQISNVFAWLLDVGGTHYLGDRFVRIFIDEVNQSRPDSAPFPYDGYEVRQEVNTASVLGAADIADIVLDSSAARLVVENYYTSDGHGHSYEDYLAYSASDDRQGEVVLLCRDEDRSRQSDGWENARILTYSTLIDRLHSEVAADPGYQKENPDALSFIEQLHRKFVSERGRVKEPDVLKFVTVMCDTGEAERFGRKGQDAVAEQFASDVAVQARERFVEGRELLQRVKHRLRDFGDGPLREQLNASLGPDRVRRVSATYAGIYQWVVNVEIEGLDTDSGETQIQLNFGPSAWFANERNSHWEHRPDPRTADYSFIYPAHVQGKALRQSTVTIHEVLEGLEPTDDRLHDEILRLISDYPQD